MPPLPSVWPASLWLFLSAPPTSSTLLSRFPSASVASLASPFHPGSSFLSALSPAS